MRNMKIKTPTKSLNSNNRIQNWILINLLPQWRRKIKLEASVISSISSLLLWLKIWSQLISSLRNQKMNYFLLRSRALSRKVRKYLRLLQKSIRRTFNLKKQPLKRTLFETLWIKEMIYIDLILCNLLNLIWFQTLNSKYKFNESVRQGNLVSANGAISRSQTT